LPSRGAHAQAPKHLVHRRLRLIDCDRLDQIGEVEDRHYTLSVSISTCASVTENTRLKVLSVGETGSTARATLSVRGLGTVTRASTATTRSSLPHSPSMRAASPVKSELVMPRLQYARRSSP